MAHMLYSQYTEIAIYKVGGDISDGAKTLIVFQNKTPLVY
jgi:hypothetical protein